MCSKVKSGLQIHLCTNYNTNGNHCSLLMAIINVQLTTFRKKCAIQDFI